MTDVEAAQLRVAAIANAVEAFKHAPAMPYSKIIALAEQFETFALEGKIIELKDTTRE